MADGRQLVRVTCLEDLLQHEGQEKIPTELTALFCFSVSLLIAHYFQPQQRCNRKVGQYCHIEPAALEKCQFQSSKRPAHSSENRESKAIFGRPEWKSEFLLALGRCSTIIPGCLHGSLSECPWWHSGSQAFLTDSFLPIQSVVREQSQDNLSKILGIFHDILKYVKPVGLDQNDQADKSVVPSESTERIYLVPFNRTKVVTMESINALKDQLLECRS